MDYLLLAKLAVALLMIGAAAGGVMAWRDFVGHTTDTRVTMVAVGCVVGVCFTCLVLILLAGLMAGFRFIAS